MKTKSRLTTVKLLVLIGSFALVASYAPSTGLSLTQDSAARVSGSAVLASAPALFTETPAIAFGATKTPYLEYALENGYIHNWLVAGPRAIALDHVGPLGGQDARRDLIGRYHQKDAGITRLPVESESLVIGDDKFTWRYHRTLEDHFLDLSGVYRFDHYLRTWAYTRISSAAGQPATFILTTDGPADVWLNGQHIHHQEHLIIGEPQSVSFQGQVLQGGNDILVRLERVAVGETPCAMALRIVVPPSEQAFGPVPLRAQVLLPTSAGDVARRQVLEEMLEQAYVEREVYHKGDRIILRWADDLNSRGQYAFQIQDQRNRIYVNGVGETGPSESVDVGHPIRLWERDYRVVLGALPQEFYASNVRYQRQLPIHVVDNAYSAEPYGTYKDRRVEALQDAARRKSGLFAEIAGLALGHEPDRDQITKVLVEIDRRYVGSDTALLGVLGIAYRYANVPAFSAVLEQQLNSAVPHSHYWMSEPQGSAETVAADGSRILYYANQILAGQRYPDWTFGDTGKTGRWHQQQGERAALAWLRTRARTGVGDWDSSAQVELYATALSHLAELAERRAVRERAASALDSMFVSLALDSYRGVYGSTQRYASTPMVKSGRLASTAGISRLLWGVGIYNRHIEGTVSLATSTYELPPTIADIAVDPSAELWNPEHRTGRVESQRVWSARGLESGKVTYKTPDYMLSSAQDYWPGQKGDREHIWQATLGPDALIFVNHPANMSEHDARGANFWRGNRVLPRVAQWKDALIAVHRLPEDDWMGFTHAYLPVHAFDEVVIRSGWAFARQGDGYVALIAAQGIELIRSGPSAFRELRSYGRENTWLCLMGRQAVDGTFAEFQRAVLALDVSWGGSAVRLETPRGETLSFGWEEPLRIDGEVRPVTGFER